MECPRNKIGLPYAWNRNRTFSMRSREWDFLMCEAEIGLFSTRSWDRILFSMRSQDRNFSFSADDITKISDMDVQSHIYIYIWGVSRQLSQRAAREPQIVLFLTHVYDTKMYLKKLFDKRFRRSFSSAFQWCKQFFQNFSFSPSKSTKHVISQKVYF